MLRLPTLVFLVFVWFFTGEKVLMLFAGEKCKTSRRTSMEVPPPHCVVVGETMGNHGESMMGNSNAPSEAFFQFYYSPWCVGDEWEK